MMKLAAAALVFAACTTNAPSMELVRPVAGLADNQIHLVDDGDSRLIPISENQDFCAVLPPGGACADACDPTALANDIPPGVCALIVCHLTDGRTVNIGGCN